VYLIAEIDLKFGRIHEFNEVMGQIVPILEKQGWKLETSFISVIGRVGHVIDVFKVTDSNGVVAAQQALRADPEFTSLMKRFVDIIDEERTMLAVRTPYAA
jgi:NIPSNAP